MQRVGCEEADGDRQCKWTGYEKRWLHGVRRVTVASSLDRPKKPKERKPSHLHLVRGGTGTGDARDPRQYPGLQYLGLSTGLRGTRR